ncbi:MAG: DinB family protein, partial [Clostridiales bacterium]
KENIMDNEVLRKELINLLKEEQAHVGIENAIRGVKHNLINKRPGNEEHTLWELFEHMRITQEDILRYTLDTSWKSPSWPDEYWPKPTDEATQEKWDKSVRGFYKDFQEVIKLVENISIDLTSQIPGGEGRTYLREILLIADHNAYHLAQIILTRKLLGDWK